MVHTIEKLIHLIYDCEEKIKQCKIKLHHFYHNRDGLKKLEEEKTALKKLMISHIQEFKEKIKNNHLETRLYANRLAILEKKFQLQPRIMNANLFCLYVLKEKHRIIKKDKIFFSGINKKKEASICQEELEMIEIQSQLLLKEFFEKINKSPDNIDKEIKLQFNALLHYYGWGLDKRKITLDKRQVELKSSLESYEKKLKSIQVLFNYRLTKQIITEIKKIKEELLEIELQNSNNIDYIL